MNANTYASKKSLAQGMLDLALLAANASQLKYILTTGESHEFYGLLLTLVITSICLQVGCSSRILHYMLSVLQLPAYYIWLLQHRRFLNIHATPFPISCTCAINIALLGETFLRGSIHGERDSNPLQDISSGIRILLCTWLDTVCGLMSSFDVKFKFFVHTKYALVGQFVFIIYRRAYTSKKNFYLSNAGTPGCYMRHIRTRTRY